MESKAIETQSLGGVSAVSLFYFDARPSADLTFALLQIRKTRANMTVVEFDLKSPSMVHGKKAFDRLVYACKNSLSSPIQWLISCPGSAVPSGKPPTPWNVI
jgi:hypothetical protein